MHTMCNCEFTQPYIVSLIDCAVTVCLHCTPVYFQEVSTFKGQDIYTTLTCCVVFFFFLKLDILILQYMKQVRLHQIRIKETTTYNFHHLSISL